MSSLPQWEVRTVVRSVAILLALLILVGYGLFEARFLIAGPSIAIERPHNGATLTESSMVVEGIAKNVAAITLNDRKIFVDGEGHFEERVLLLPGYNVLSVSVTDRFGRSTTKVLELVYQEPDTGTTTQELPVD